MTKFALVVSDFNDKITHQLAKDALLHLRANGITDNNVVEIHVPGAIEIPLAAQSLARTQAFAAIICIGAVIRGETSHYDYVCSQVSNGCQQVMLENNLPIIFGVLTTENEEQAFARCGGSAGNKGVEFADAALQMVKVTNDIKQFESNLLSSSFSSLADKIN